MPAPGFRARPGYDDSKPIAGHLPLAQFSETERSEMMRLSRQDAYCMVRWARASCKRCEPSSFRTWCRAVPLDLGVSSSSLRSRVPEPQSRAGISHAASRCVSNPIALSVSGPCHQVPGEAPIRLSTQGSLRRSFRAIRTHRDRSMKICRRRTTPMCRL